MLMLRYALPVLLLVSCAGSGKSGCGGGPSPEPVSVKPEDKPDAAQEVPKPQALPEKDKADTSSNPPTLPMPNRRCRTAQFKECVECYIEAYTEWASQQDPVWRDINVLCQALEAGNVIHSWNDPYNACLETGVPVAAWVTRSFMICDHLHTPNQTSACETVYQSRQLRDAWSAEKNCP